MWAMLNENKNAVAFILFLVGQIILVVVWAGHIDQKVTENRAKIEILDSVGGRQVHSMLSRIAILERNIERIDETLHRLPVMDERITVLRSQIVELGQQNKAIYKLQSENGTPVDIDNLPENLKQSLQKLQKQLDEESPK